MHETFFKFRRTPFFFSVLSTLYTILIVVSNFKNLSQVVLLLNNDSVDWKTFFRFLAILPFIGPIEIVFYFCFFMVMCFKKKSVKDFIKKRSGKLVFCFSFRLKSTRKNPFHFQNLLLKWRVAIFTCITYESIEYSIETGNYDLWIFIYSKAFVFSNCLVI